MTATKGFDSGMGKLYGFSGKRQAHLAEVSC